MSRRGVALLLAATILGAAPTARAAERMVPLVDAASPVQSTGNGFAWTTRDQHLRITDVRGRTLHDVPLAPERCTFAGATDAGVALIACYDDHGDTGEWLLDASTGARTPIAVRGESFAIGRAWIEGSDSRADCVRCDARLYTNWHTGEERFGGGRGDTTERDLDDPDLPLVPRKPRFRVRRLRDRDAAILYRRTRGGWERVARCRSFCRLPQAGAGWVTFVDSGRRQLVERDLRTGRTRRWRLPSDGGRRSLTVQRIGDALVVARQVPSDPKTWRVWRADR